MKDIKLVILIFIASHSFSISNGHVQKGSILTDIDLNLYTSHRKYYTGGGSQAPGEISSKTFSLTPSFGFFLSAGTMIYLMGSITNQKDEDTFTGINPSPESRSSLFGPFSRYWY